jgi:tRNA dimethylallyltransferase
MTLPFATLTGRACGSKVKGKTLMGKGKYLVIIAGPTAVGKTQLAIELARHFHTEIVNADSRQIYREMKIGTAVPSERQLEAIRHHLVGSRSVQEYYNASLFEFEVIELLSHLFQQHDLVIMTGGSGMYIDAVRYGIDDLPTVNAILRENLKMKFGQQGIEWLQSQVREHDPDFYQSTDINNPKRLLKALEIITQTGRPYSSFLTRRKKERDFMTISIGINLERSRLYENINLRVERMIEEGLAEEVKKLLPYRKLNALNTVGYKEIFDCFDGKISLDEAKDLIKRHTRQYARRQLTWFRKDKNIRWFAPDEKEAIIQYISDSLSPHRV